MKKLKDSSSGKLGKKVGDIKAGGLDLNGFSFEVDIYGPACSAATIRDVDGAINSAGLDCRVSGEKTPAAGSELAYNLLIRLTEEVSVALVCAAVKHVAKCVHGCLVNHQIEAGRIIIEPPGERIVVESCPAAGVSLKEDDYIQVLKRVFAFLDAQKNAEPPIKEVKVPWDINELLSDLSDYPVGTRRFGKWRLTYSDDTCRVYDSYLAEYVDL